MYDLRYSTTLSAGSSDEIPLKFSDSGLSFSTEGCMKGEISVCGCESFEPCIKVPEYVNGGRSRYHVVAIAPNAFSEKTSISSIILPESIRDIGYRAFYGCSSMNDFILPSSVRRIGFRAFEGCVSLSSIAISFKNPFFRTFPGGLLCSLKKVDGRLVPSEVIRAPYSLSGSVTVPEGITKIGSESFEGCSGLTEVVLPDEVSAVMYRAFVGCSSLEHVCVPDRTSVGFHAFPDSVSVETRQVGGPSGEVLQE